MPHIIPNLKTAVKICIARLVLFLIDLTSIKLKGLGGVIRDRDFHNSALIDLDPHDVVCRPWPVVDPTVAVNVKIEDRLFELLGVFDKFLEKVAVIRIRVSKSEDDEAADRVAETLPSFGDQANYSRWCHPRMSLTMWDSSTPVRRWSRP